MEVLLVFSSSCSLCRGRRLGLQLLSRGLAFPDCLLPINQPLTLDASRIFERDSGSFVTEASVVFNLLSSRH